MGYTNPRNIEMNATGWCAERFSKHGQLSTDQQEEDANKWISYRKIK